MAPVQLGWNALLLGMGEVFLVVGASTADPVVPHPQQGLWLARQQARGARAVRFVLPGAKPATGQLDALAGERQTLRLRTLPILSFTEHPGTIIIGSQGRGRGEAGMAPLSVGTLNSVLIVYTNLS